MLLEEIGTEARTLIEATGDMSWALDPRQDSLGSIIARLRRLANDLLENKGARLVIEIPESMLELQLTSENRRNLYLILKEALNNSLRHADANHVELRGSALAHQLVFEVEDDGAGFDRETARIGQGLANMERRSDELGGRFEVVSEPGRGTRIRIEIPV